VLTSLIRSLSLVLGFLLLTNSCSTFNKIKNVDLDEVSPRLTCEKERGALDIGSGSTKFTYAKVDICKNTILKVIAKAQFPLKFKEHITFNNGRLRDSIFVKASQNIKAYFKSIKIDSRDVRAVATEAFRQADNGEAFLDRLSQAIGVKINLITQEDEALLGFKGAEAVTNKKKEDIIVWDIGGGSMQMTSFHLGSYDFYKGKLASVSLKNEVLKWEGKERGSPNPLGQYIGQRAVYYSSNYAKDHVPESIKNGINEGKEVIGIGGVHYHSLRKQLNLYPNTPYSLYQLKKALDERVSFHDQQFQGDYKETEATNLALVLGHMKALGIRTVLPVKVNLTTGLLFTERFW